MFARIPLAGAAAPGKPLAQFVDPLPVPGAGWPVIDLRGGGAATIPVRQTAVQVHSGLPAATNVWAYGDLAGTQRSTYLGPTIVVQKDREVTVTFSNELPSPPAGQPPQPLFRTDPMLVPGVPHGGPASVTPAELRINTHLHGGHIADSVDGNPYAQDYTRAGAAPAGGPVSGRDIIPGESQTLGYENSNDAGLIWYHDHAVGVTRTNVYAGLAGGYVVTDAADPFAPEGSPAWDGGLGLPGLGFDIPLVIQDRAFQVGKTNNLTGQFFYPFPWAPEFFADTVLVNGKAWPFLAVGARKYRFRVLNGSQSRFYNLSFGGAPIQQIGGDQGLLAAPATVTSVLVAPGERADVVVDFNRLAGTAANPTSLLVTDLPLPAGTVSPTKPIGPIMQIRVGAAVADQSDVPASLGSAPDLTTNLPTRYVTLDEVLGNVKHPASPGGNKPLHALLNNTPFLNMLNGTVIGPPEQVALNATEQWDLINLTADTHPIHLHLVKFQVVERQAFTKAGLNAYQARLAAARARDPKTVLPPVLPPDPAAELAPIAANSVRAEEKGWKDTVRANPGEVTRIRATFDKPGRYVVHCHILEHEENEMMRPFLVEAPVP